MFVTTTRETQSANSNRYARRGAGGTMAAQPVGRGDFAGLRGRTHV